MTFASMEKSFSEVAFFANEVGKKCYLREKIPCCRRRKRSQAKVVTILGIHGPPRGNVVMTGGDAHGPKHPSGAIVERTDVGWGCFGPTGITRVPRYPHMLVYNDVMRAHIHLLASAAAGIAIYPRFARRALLLTLAGVLIDVDHYILYALRSGDWSLPGTLAYERRRHHAPQPGDTRPRYGPLRSIIHRPQVTLPILALLSIARPGFRPVLLGAALHLALDAHYIHYDWRVWQRAKGRCERCHKTTNDLEVYYRCSPKRGGSRWTLENRVLLCNSCVHELWKEDNTRRLNKEEKGQKIGFR